jgi:hypothetical protein
MSETPLSSCLGAGEVWLKDCISTSAQLTARHCAAKAATGMDLDGYLSHSGLRDNKRRLVRFLLAPVYSLFQIAHIAKQVNDS